MSVFRRVMAIGVLAVGLFAVAGPAPAGVIWSFTETGGNVVGTMSGSINTTGLTLNSNPTKIASGIGPIGAIVASGPNVGCSGTLNAYAVTPFGPGAFTATATTTGDLFDIDNGFLCLPLGYTSGSALSGTLTFTGATFASLGITPGTYVESLPHDSVTLNFGAVAAPEPATLALLGLGFAGFAFSRRRKMT